MGSGAHMTGRALARDEDACTPRRSHPMSTGKRLAEVT